LKLLFINPPVSHDCLYGQWDMSELKSTSPPIGLLSIAAYEREKKNEVMIIDAMAENLSFKQIAERVKKFMPDTVGLTAMTIQMESASRIASFIKTLYPFIKVILGGSHVTALPYETSRKYSHFDDYIIGEWEQYDRLDDLPFPAFDLIDFSKYRLSPFGTKSSHSVGLITSRGCPGKCTFCDRSVFGNKVRMHSASYVIALMDKLNREHGVSDFLFYDDLFVAHRKRLIEICYELKNRNYTWSCCARVDSVQADTLAMMKEAGCWLIEFGIESGSQKMLDFMKKGITIEKAEEAIRLTKKAGIASKGNFIIGHPGETRETLEGTLRFIRKTQLTYFQHTFFTPLPGSEAYAFADNYGIRSGSWDRYNTFAINYVPNGLTKEDLLHYSKKMWKAFYLRPRTIINQLTNIRSRDDISRLTKGAKTFVKTVWKR